MKIRLLVLSVLVVSCIGNLTAQQWQKTDKSQIVTKGTIDITPNSYELYSLDDDQLKKLLWSAPLESTTQISKSNTILSVPIGNGAFDDFKIVEYSMMEAGLAKKYPDLKTFRGISTTNPYRHVRIDHTLYGFRAVVRDQQNTIFIDHYQRNDYNTRIVYNKKDYTNNEPWSCGVNSDNVRTTDDDAQRSMIGDCAFREYRLALACTGEYAAYHGGTEALVMSAYVTSINRVNQVYEYDIAARLILIANTNLLIYYNSNTDPYSNDNGSTMLGENQTNCDNVIGNGNYDMGHVYSTGGGGVASLGSVCNNTSKARGVTGRGAPIGDPFDIDYVAHEMGHQFGGNHTFNNSCSNNRNSNTAMEPGSGSTIMAYAGICNPNVQNNSDDYFHAISLQEINAEMTSNGHTCEVLNNTFNNSPPVVIDQPNYSIPKSTPFALKVTASDPDDDPLEYLWDQMDNAIATMPPVATNTGGPTFKSVKYTSSPTRYFPSIDNVVNNSTDTWEVLPSVARTLNFRGTAKDFHSIGGCNDEEDVVVTVVNTTGPFIVTSQNTSVTWDVYSIQTVTWNVVGTNSAPISAATVDIILSIDGGLTYTDTIAFDVPNDGSETITVPNKSTTEGRIMVKPRGNIFYDINNADITIILTEPIFELALDDNPFTICSNSGTANNTLQVGAFGGYIGDVNLGIINTSGATMQLSQTTVAAGSSTSLTVSNFSGLSGSYPIKITGSDGSLFDTLSFILNVVGTPNAPTLSLPIDGAVDIATAPLFNWSAISGASSYDLEVSTSSSFNQFTINENVTTNSFQTVVALNTFETYFWRVKTNNSCSTSIYSSTFSFDTKNCSTFTSTDVPKTISENGTPTVTSILNIPTSLIISDINVLNLEGTHSYMDDLDFTLIAPDNTSILLWNQPCNSQNNFDINFDDEAANNNWPCPPTDGLTYKPDNLLSAFDGLDAAGNWSLEIHDNANQDGGSLTNWSLEVCAVPSCNTIVTVNTTTGVGSIMEALDCAEAGDTITFSDNLIGQTINMNSQTITFSQDITLLSPNGVVTLQSFATQPFIAIQSGIKLTVEGLQLLTRIDNVPIINNSGNLVLKNSGLSIPSSSTSSAINNTTNANTTIKGTSEIKKF